MTDALLWIGIALGVLAVFLWRGLHGLRELGAQFGLLDRERLIPRLRAQLLAAVALAGALCVAALAGALVLRPPPADPVAATAESAVAGDAARPPAAAPVAPAPAPEPEPVAPPEPEPPPPPPTGWIPGRIVASGEVTLRAWPNGRQITKIPADTSLFMSGERKLAGDYEWRKVRLEDGRSGWVVARFVAAD